MQQKQTCQHPGKALSTHVLRLKVFVKQLVQFRNSFSCVGQETKCFTFQFNGDTASSRFNMARVVSVQLCAPLCTKLFRRVQYGQWRLRAAVCSAVHEVVQTGPIWPVASPCSCVLRCARSGSDRFNMARGDSLQRCAPLCTELFRQVQHGPWRFPSAMCTAVHGVVQTGMYVDFSLC
ncbi:uncharacterized protein LOC144798621 [Lissotriton helveticus]